METQIPPEARRHVTTSEPEQPPADPSTTTPPEPSDHQVPLVRADLAIRRVRLRSLARMALPLYGLVFASLVLAAVVGWLVARATGLLGGFEEIVAAATGTDSYTLPSLGLLTFGVVTAAVASLVATALTLLFGEAYNRLSQHLGGIEVDAEVADQDVVVEPAAR